MPTPLVVILTLGVLGLAYYVLVWFVAPMTDDRPTDDTDEVVPDFAGDSWAVKTQQGVPVDVRRLE